MLEWMILLTYFVHEVMFCKVFWKVTQYSRIIYIYIYIYTEIEKRWYFRCKKHLLGGLFCKL